MIVPLLSVRGLRVSFPLRSPILRRINGHIDAAADVSFDIAPSESLGLVGESGSGKSTVARALVGLNTVTAGQIFYRGVDVTAGGAARSQMQREVQMVFQDPYGSLNPRKTVGEIITEAWEIHPDITARSRWSGQVEALLGRVGIPPRRAIQYPHQFSGGQRQRIAIARALATEPRLIILDEAVAALDVSIQSQIVNLLKDLQRDLGLAYLFIAHDLAVVRQVCDRIAVMYLGRIVEDASEALFFRRPAHPYSQALLAAIPSREPWKNPVPRISLRGEPPSPRNPPSGCAFHPRCGLADARCRQERPPLLMKSGHLCACHFGEQTVTTDGVPTSVR